MPRQKIEVYPQKRLSGGRVGNKTLVAKKQNKLQAVRFVAYSIVKRFFDLAISATFLILLSPIFLIIAIVIKIDSPGPVFFRQERTGKGGRVFKIYKFRSMAVDNNVWDDSCGDKYTRVGAVLRKTSIDELPQFINVFLGQMSFIGPRPWIPEYWTNMNEEERMRSKVRPGITGLAAAKGRNGLTIFEKIAYDLEYVRNFSLLQDVKIILLTFRQLFRSEEVSVGKAGIYNEIDWLRMRNCNDKKLNRKPLVSIIIPVFNGEKVILDTIDSLWKQTYKKWEAIIVDDESKDRTKELLSKVKSKKIRVVNLEKNSGAAEARNRGISEAKGEYICFLDADDLWRADKLEKQVKFMLEKDSAFSFTGYEFANENGIGNGKIVRVPEMITYKQALKNTTISTITVMFDLNRLSKEDIYMPNIESEDTATWWNVLKVVDHADGLDESLSLYRRGGKTLSSNKLVAIKRIWALYRDHEKLNVFMSSINFVSWAFNAVRRRV